MTIARLPRLQEVVEDRQDKIRCRLSRDNKHSSTFLAESLHSAVAASRRHMLNCCERSFSVNLLHSRTALVAYNPPRTATSALVPFLMTCTTPTTNCMNVCRAMHCSRGARQ